MQTLPSEVATLLKSRSMIGANKPAYSVSIGGLARDISSTKVMQGYASTNYNISNWIKTNDGRYMCCWFDPSAKNLRTGYSSDLDFLTSDYAIESFVINTSITVSVAHRRQTSLYKFNDGSVILIVDAVGALPLTVKCYKSASGNGDDWEYLSTIHSITNTNLMKGSPFLGVPIMMASGRLVISFVGGTSADTYILPLSYIAYSDDKGVTWTTVAIGTSYADDGINQIMLFNGTLYLTKILGSGDVLLYTSTNGATWTNTGIDFYADFGDVARDNVAGLSLYYDSATDTAYAITCATSTSKGAIFKIDNPTDVKIKTASSWIWVLDFSNNTYPAGLIYNLDENLVFQSDSLTTPTSVGTEFILRAPAINVPVKSISISRNQDMAAAATVVIDNKGGIYSPDNSASAYYDIVKPGKTIVIKQGYGDNLVQTFFGYIDSVVMSSFPAEITITARDAMKLAIDQIVTADNGAHSWNYANLTVEAMFTDLCRAAGLPVPTVEATGLTIAKRLISWESYMDEFQALAEMVGFEYGADELGNVYFRKKKMPDSPTANYTFTEGVDIISLSYEISDADLYYYVTVFGQDANNAVISYTAQWVNPTFYGLSTQKILKIDATDCDTVAKCQTVAEEAIRQITSKARQVNFAAIGVPYLQIGDFIQVTESSTTISEIYRITDLSTSMDDSGYTMDIACHWYSHN